MDTESLTKTGVTTAPSVIAAPPLPWTALTIGGLEYSVLTRFLFAIVALIIFVPLIVKDTFAVSKSTPSILNLVPGT